MKTSEKIVEYLKDNGQSTTTNLVDYLGITDRAVRKQLRALLDLELVKKVGKPPRVYYSLAEPKNQIQTPTFNIPEATKKLIDGEFYYISARGVIHEAYEGFVYWCQERNLDPSKTAEQYAKTMNKYYQYKKDGLIDGMYKLKNTFSHVALDEVFYADFYSIEIFGKTKLGQMLLFAKQSQNRKLIYEIADIVKPSILHVIQKYNIDGVGFIPPTVKRELQLIKLLENRLNFNLRTVPINKIKTPVTVPQKTLSKLEDRIVNAGETMIVDTNSEYENILLVDDALGSGATLNEVAKKIRQKGICKGKIIGFVITGSFKGFDVISEV
ncbi:MAG TPA: DeoR family transcriptional regulator [Candidatus Saccharimonadales bacterium]|jgi:DNA-binding transcriptional ArsR family regulator